MLAIVATLGACYCFSTTRNAIRIKSVAWGVGLQFFFAILVTKFTYGQTVMAKAGSAVNHLLSYAGVGAQFMFGTLGTGGPLLNAIDNSPAPVKVGFVFAFQVLPTIIFIAAFFAVMYYLGIMQLIIKQMAKFMTYVMGVSGAESLDVAASIFMRSEERRVGKG